MFVEEKCFLSWFLHLPCHLFAKAQGASGQHGDGSMGCAGGDSVRLEVMVSFVASLRDRPDGTTAQRLQRTKPLGSTEESCMQGVLSAAMFQDGIIII